MCSVKTESCCSIWLNCLSGSMQTDNCLDPPAHKLESTRLFVLVLSLFTCWKSFLKVIWLFLRGNRNCWRKITVLLFCIHVAHKLPGPSWKRQSYLRYPDFVGRIFQDWFRIIDGLNFFHINLIMSLWTAGTEPHQAPKVEVNHNFRWYWEQGTFSYNVKQEMRQIWFSSLHWQLISSRIQLHPSWNVKL